MTAVKTIFSDMAEEAGAKVYEHPDLDKLASIKNLPVTVPEIIKTLHFFDKLNYRFPFCDEQITVQAISKSLFYKDHYPQVESWQDLIILFEDPDQNISENPCLLKYFDYDPTNINHSCAITAFPETVKFIKNMSADLHYDLVRASTACAHHIEDLTEDAQVYMIKKESKTIGWIKSPTPKVQLLAVQNNANVIQMIAAPTIEAQICAAKNCDMSLVLSVNFCEEAQLILIARSPRIIEYLKNPTDTVKLAAVTQQASAIKYITNPTTEMQIVVIKNGPVCAISYIKNPCEAALIAAMERSSANIKFVEDPSEAVQLAAVTNNYRCYRHLKNPTETVLLKIIEQCPLYLKQFQREHFTEAVQQLAVSKDYRALQYAYLPSEAVKLAAIKNNYLALKWISSPTPEMLEIAVTQNPNALKFIKNPSEELQLLAVKNNIAAMAYIKNPTDAVKKYVAEKTPDIDNVVDDSDLFAVPVKNHSKGHCNQITKDKLCGRWFINDTHFCVEKPFSDKIVVGIVDDIATNSLQQLTDTQRKYLNTKGWDTQ